MKNFKQRRGLKAFTLIEMLMVITIIGILTVAVAPRMIEVMNDVKVKGAAKKLVGDIRYAQGIAMSKHTNTTVVFYSSGNGYYLRDNDAYAIDPSNNTYLIDPFSRGPAIMVFGSGNQFAGVDITNFNFINGTLLFDYQGNPHSGLVTPLPFNGTVNFSCGNQVSGVTVTAGTGQALGF